MEAAGLYLKILIRGMDTADLGFTNNLEKLAKDQKDVSDPGILEKKMCCRCLTMDTESKHIFRNCISSPKAAMIHA